MHGRATMIAEARVRYRATEVARTTTRAHCKMAMANAAVDAKQVRLRRSIRQHVVMTRHHARVSNAAQHARKGVLNA